MIDWKRLVISGETTIRQALAIIDAGGIQIALVLGPDGHLVGTVTDGDIRRGILNGMSLDDSVGPLVFIRPVTGREGETREMLLRRMREQSVRQLPVLDAEGRVIRLELEKDLALPWRDNLVVIMAGGLGTRLRPLTETCPKPMLEIGGRPLLEIILLKFREQGFSRIALSVNYKAHVIEEYFGDGSNHNLQISYLKETQRLGTGGALSLLEQRPDEPFIVMNADLLTNIDFRTLVDFHMLQGTVCTMGVRQYDIQVPYGVVTVEDNLMRSIVEKPVDSYFVNAGIYVLNPEVLDFVHKDKYCDMTTLLPEMQAAGLETSVFPVRDYWLDIGNLGDFERAQRDAGNGLLGDMGHER